MMRFSNPNILEINPQYEQILKKSYIQNPDTVNLGMPESIDKKINEYQNKQLRDRLEDFKRYFPLYREIRGDGNCFYRAFAFYYFENLLSSNDQDAIISILQDAENNEKQLFCSCFEETIPYVLKPFINKFHMIFMAGLQKIYTQSNKSRQDIQKKLCLLINYSPAFDISLILFLRGHALRALDNFKDELKEFYQNNERQLIQKCGEEGQNVIIRLLCEQLNVELTIKSIEKNQSTDYVIDPQFVKNKNQKKQRIFLFFRPGHYDLCYSQEESYTYYYEYIEKKKLPQTYSQNARGSTPNEQQSQIPELFMTKSICSDRQSNLFNATEKSVGANPLPINAQQQQQQQQQPNQYQSSEMMSLDEAQALEPDYLQEKNLLKIEMQQIKKANYVLNTEKKQYEIQVNEQNAQISKYKLYLCILIIISSLVFSLMIYRDSNGSEADFIGEGGVSHNMVDPKYLYYGTSEDDIAFPYNLQNQQGGGGGLIGGEEANIFCNSSETPEGCQTFEDDQYLQQDDQMINKMPKTGKHHHHTKKKQSKHQQVE